MQRCIPLLAALVLGFVVPDPSLAATWNVPSPECPTIQAGLDSAATSDTVLVAAGEYQESLFWPYRNGIVLIGAGMDSTVVVGDQSECVLLMVDVVEIDSTTVVQDLCLRGGGDAGLILYGASPHLRLCLVDSTHNGPGIACFSQSRAVIGNCHITDNQGPGILIEACDSALVIKENAILRNVTTEYGGGIYCGEQCSATIWGNVIAQNTALSGGAGVFCSHGASPKVVSNTISANAAPSGHGGGIYCWEYSYASILDNVIANNTAEQNGGGIYCTECSPAVQGNWILGNEAAYGGGIACCCWSPHPEISENILANNVALYDGGGLYCYHNIPSPIQRNALVRNFAVRNGGGMACVDESFPALSNSTITENVAGSHGDGVYTEDAFPTLSSCNIAFNGYGLHNASYASVPVAQNNWWGHATGPWHSGGNPAGQGDSLSTYAWDFVPWLAEADTTAPPFPPMGLELDGSGENFLVVSWQPVPLADLEAYRIYFDSDTTGFPYADTLDVGNVTQALLPSLGVGTTYYIAVTCYDHGNDESWYSAELIASTNNPAANADASDKWLTLRLDPNLPNPFRAQTAISYFVPAHGRAQLEVYDLQGRRVVTLEDAIKALGWHSVLWNGRDEAGLRASPGVYFLRLDAGGQRSARKLVLIK